MPVPTDVQNRPNSKLLATTLLFAPLAAHLARTPTAFEVQDLNVRATGSGSAQRLNLSGKLLNKCAEAATAQLRIDVKDASGAVLQNKQCGPTGATHIASGQSVDFDPDRCAITKPTCRPTPSPSAPCAPGRFLASRPTPPSTRQLRWRVAQ